MRRWVPWITTIAVIAGLGWTFVYMKDLHPLGSIGTKLDNSDLSGLAIRFKNAQLVGRSNGKKVWQFDADMIDLSKDRRLATFRGIKRGTLLEDDKQVASLSAAEVTYNTFTQNVVVPGAAEFALKDGPSFEVRDLLWDAGKSTLTCKGGVDASLAGSTLRGERMVVHLDEKELTIDKVKGQIKLKQD